MEQVIGLSKIIQGKVGIFFPPLLHMLKLTQIKGEKKKKDTVFLNVTHHILKTDCTEHYHAHNKPAGKTSTFVMVFLVFSFSFT